MHIRKIFIITVSFLSLVFYSCSEQVDIPEIPVYPNNGNLVVHASIFSKLNDYSFTPNTDIGMFVCTGNSDVDYDKRIPDNLKCTFDGEQWNVRDSIPLNDNNAIIYAYYPYIQGDVKAKYIPVTCGDGIDYLFGSSNLNQKLNRNNPYAEIVMKHAQALIRFNLIKDTSRDPYYGKAIVKSARIIEFDADSLEMKVSSTVRKGTLNIENGIISPSEIGYIYIKGLEGKQFKENGTTDDTYPCTMVFPRKSLKNIGILLNIDDKDFLLPFNPESDWIAGTKNLYNITISGHSLDFDKDNSVKIEEWEDFGNEGMDF